MRDINRRRLIRAVMVAPGSQASLARRTHLSQATVSTAVNELLQEGVLISDAGEGERGKRLRLGPVRGVAVGVEVNHNSLTVAARPVGSSEIEYAGIDFGADQAGDLWVKHGVRLINEAVAQTGLTKEYIVSIGVGIPAAIDPRTSKITQVSSSLGWDLTGDPREQFKIQFPTVPVIIDNEANLAAYGEYIHGAGQNGHETMLFVKASTGIGAGLIIGGLIYRGRHGIAGEIGHLIMDPHGTVCRCGNRGCLETQIGGIRLLEQVRQAYTGYRIDFPATLESMIERAKGGDPVCRRVLHDAARVMGLALAKVCNVVNPEIVVLGGELGMASDLLLTTIRDAMRLHALRGMFDPDFAPVQVVGSELGRQGGARGALSFALHVDQPIRPE
jgi:predicted NBD/HSP70 family sugar kinase